MFVSNGSGVEVHSRVFVFKKDAKRGKTTLRENSDEFSTSNYHFSAILISPILLNMLYLKRICSDVNSDEDVMGNDIHRCRVRSFYTSSEDSETDLSQILNLVQREGTITHLYVIVDVAVGSNRF